MEMVKLNNVYSMLNDENKDFRGSHEITGTYTKRVQTMGKEREQKQPTRQVFGL